MTCQLRYAGTAHSHRGREHPFTVADFCQCFAFTHKIPPEHSGQYILLFTKIAENGLFVYPAN
jgi:hypothetical protein